MAKDMYEMKEKASKKSGKWATQLTETTRHCDSKEYLKDVMDSPYYTSSGEAGSDAKQDPGMGGSWVK